MLHFDVIVQGAGDQAPLSATFDEALSKLAALPRLFIEPDGSFVWAGTAPSRQLWQVDGNLIDRGDVLAYVELKGSCPEEQFDELLRTLGWPEANFCFQLTRQGRVVTEKEFRQLAATGAHRSDGPTSDL